MERKIVFISLLLFIISQFIILGALFFSGILRFEISTPEQSKLFDVQTVLYEKKELSKDSIASKNYYSYQMLLKKERELKRMEDSLKVEKERLELLKKEIEQRKREIEAAKKQIEQYVLESRNLIKKKETAKDKEYKKLAKIYSNMDPKQAADLLSKLDSKTAVEILKRINPELAGPIMDNLKNSKKGVAITKAALEKYK